MKLMRCSAELQPLIPNKPSTRVDEMLHLVLTSAIRFSRSYVIWLPDIAFLESV